MTREQAKDYIKQQLEDYLSSRGIDTRKPFICLNPDHPDKRPSMSLDKKNNQVHCFSCNAKYDVLDLIGIEYHLKTPAEIFKKAYEIYGITLEGRTSPVEPFKQAKAQTPYNHAKNEPQAATAHDYRAYVEKSKEALKNSQEAIRYLQGRGLTSVIDRLGYDADKKHIVIPYDEAGSYYTTRAMDKKEYRNAPGPKSLFNAQALYNSTGAVFVTEGPLDALSIMEVGGEAIALSGVDFEHLKRQLDRKPTESTLILTLDNDEAGSKAAEDLELELKQRKIDCFIANISGERKDANEALTADRGQFKQAVEDTIGLLKAKRRAEKEAEIEEYQKESAYSHIAEFLEGIMIDTPAIPTGFKELDNSLDGGLYEGLYILGAISSLGKTTFVLQIADQIAQQGHDVLIFSLEMARSELMAKSISRLTFQNCKGVVSNAKTTRGITARKRYENYSPEELRLINKSITAYEEYAKRLYISHGLGNIGAQEIGEAVKKHLMLTGNKPIVVIDYLQILKAEDPRSTDKQNTDKAVFCLKRISRDYKIPIIAISSLNRDSYTNKISMKAFKESGAIEYSSDVLLGLQFQKANQEELNEGLIDAERRKATREIELKILKNRNGQTGDQINYSFISMFNHFLEAGKARGQ